MEKRLEFSEDEAREIIWGDHDDFDVVERVIDGVSRWAIHSTVVVKRLSDSTYWMSTFSEGATEIQDQAPYEYDKPVFVRCEPQRVMTTKYVEVE